MIFLSGSINTATAEAQQREAQVYQGNGWELKDPTTHEVRVTVEQKDMEAFIQYLRSLPLDKKPRVWTDRNGTEHVSETVSFWLKGTEMAGNWIKLRAAIRDQPQGDQQRGGSARPQAQTARPGRPPATPKPPVPQPTPQLVGAAANSWATTASDPATDNDFDEDIPF